MLEEDWILDLDVQKFFDSVDHDLMVKAVEANTDRKWVVLYVKRWLRAPMRLPGGTMAERTGEPRGVGGITCTGKSFHALRV